MDVTVAHVGIRRVGPAHDEPRADVVAVEEPLEIRLGGQPFVVVMRTPGADRALAAGFLLSEGILRRADEIASMRHCAAEPPGEPQHPPGDQNPGEDPDRPLASGPQDGAGHVLTVWLHGEAAVRAAAAVAGRRHVVASASCGVCGRQQIDDLVRQVGRVDAPMRISRAVLSALPETLRGAQRAFAATGGLHAAGLFDVSGALDLSAEDVGRHNAVDKVIGAALLRGGAPAASRVLCVSGRTSFEIVQKAAAAGIPVVAAVSAPSTLAVALARETGVTLCGFVRDGSFNVYSADARIV